MSKIVDLQAYRVKKHVERQKKEQAERGRRWNPDVFASQAPKRADSHSNDWTDCPF